MKAKFEILAIGFILVATCGAQAQTIFFTSFSSAEGYTSGPLVDQPAGASEMWVDGAESVPAVNFEIVDEALVTTVDLSGSKWVYIMMPVQKESITATWDWRYVGPEDGLVDTGINFSDSMNYNLDGNPELTWNEQGAMIRMTHDTANGTGVIDVRDGDWDGGGAYAALEELHYQDGVTIHMRAEIDIVAWTYTVYGQREGEDEVMIAQDYGFRRLPSAETDGLNCIAIWEDVSDDAHMDNQCIIDNVLVAGPEGATGLTDWSLY